MTRAARLAACFALVGCLYGGCDPPLGWRYSREFPRAVFGAADLDQDAVLTPTEAGGITWTTFPGCYGSCGGVPGTGAQLTTKEFGDADADRDGKLTYAELGAWYPTTMYVEPALVRPYDLGGLDCDRDGVFSFAEAGALRLRDPALDAWPRVEAAAVKAADVDGDGALSRAELEALAKPHMPYGYRGYVPVLPVAYGGLGYLPDPGPCATPTPTPTPSPVPTRRPRATPTATASPGA